MPPMLLSMYPSLMLLLRLLLEVSFSSKNNFPKKRNLILFQIASEKDRRRAICKQKQKDPSAINFSNS